MAPRVVVSVPPDIFSQELLVSKQPVCCFLLFDVLLMISVSMIFIESALCTKMTIFDRTIFYSHVLVKYFQLLLSIIVLTFQYVLYSGGCVVIS